jgi:hypothetical protein
MNADVTLQSINCNNNSNSRRHENPDYWSRRRTWWRAHKAELGTDWDSINRLQVEIASFLAHVKRRRAA